MNQVKTEETITLSENAVAHLKHIKANDASKAVLLLRVDAGGCSGFQYQFSIGDNADGSHIVRIGKRINGRLRARTDWLGLRDQEPQCIEFLRVRKFVFFVKDNVYSKKRSLGWL
jgi:hypothetical protein